MFCEAGIRWMPVFAFVSPAVLSLCMSNLSALVVAHNEEAILDDCLVRLSFADEIVLVADRCTDETVAIAKRHNAK